MGPNPTPAAIRVRAYALARKPLVVKPLQNNCSPPTVTVSDSCQAPRHPQVKLTHCPGVGGGVSLNLDRDRGWGSVDNAVEKLVDFGGAANTFSKGPSLSV